MTAWKFRVKTSVISFILKISAFDIFYLMYNITTKVKIKSKLKKKMIIIMLKTKFIKVYSVDFFVANVTMETMETQVYFTGRLVLIGGNHGRNVSSH